MTDSECRVASTVIGSLAIGGYLGSYIAPIAIIIGIIIGGLAGYYIARGCERKISGD